MKKIIFILLIIIANSCGFKNTVSKLSKNEIVKLIDSEDFYYNETNKTFKSGMLTGSMYINIDFSTFTFNESDSTLNIKGFVFLPGNVRVSDVNIILGNNILTNDNCKTVGVTDKQGFFKIKIKSNEKSKLYFSIMNEGYVGLCYNIGELYSSSNSPLQIQR